MSTHGNLTVVATLVAATIAGTAAAAAISATPEPVGPSRPAAQTTATSPTYPGPATLSGEHALEYLSQLAREAVAAGKSGTESPGTPQRKRGTNSDTLSAAQRGEPVGAGGTSGGYQSPVTLTNMR